MLLSLTRDDPNLVPVLLPLLVAVVEQAAAAGLEEEEEEEKEGLGIGVRKNPKRMVSSLSGKPTCLPVIVSIN